MKKNDFNDENRRQDIYVGFMESPIGGICIKGSSRGIVELDFLTSESQREHYQNRGTETKTSGDGSLFVDEAIIQLNKYFSGRLREFNLPLDLRGTEFQVEVWRQLLKIPYGETRAYSDIAEAISRPKAQRAVGMANNRNPIAIIVPCHRVIGKNGGLTGYASGLDHKRFLLDLEQKFKG